MIKEVTTIKISKDLVSRLSSLKVHPRQAYEEVILKLLEFYKKNEE
jgi:predicted CopG family antitoxin